MPYSLPPYVGYPIVDLWYLSYDRKNPALQDTAPAAGHESDITLFRRSAIYVLMTGNSFEFPVTRKKLTQQHTDEPAQTSVFTIAPHLQSDDSHTSLKCMPKIKSSWKSYLSAYSPFTAPHLCLTHQKRYLWNTQPLSFFSWIYLS